MAIVKFPPVFFSGIPIVADPNAPLSCFNEETGEYEVFGFEIDGKLYVNPVRLEELKRWLANETTGAASTEPFPKSE